MCAQNYFHAVSSAYPTSIYSNHSDEYTSPDRFHSDPICNCQANIDRSMHE